MNRPFITLDAVRTAEGCEPIIRVAFLGFPLAHYQREETESAFAFAYGFAHAARLAGVAEPLTAWNLDFAALDFEPEFIGEARELCSDEVSERIPSPREYYAEG